MKITNKGIKAVLVYVLSGLAWIILSDLALKHIGIKLDYQLVQTLKGIAFILFTGILLAILIHRNEKHNKIILKVLKQSESDTLLLLNNTEENFIVVDEDLKVISFNKQFKENYKTYLNRNVNYGDNILNYVVPERREALSAIYAKALKGESIENEMEVPVANGETLYFSNLFKPAFDYSGKIVGVIVTAFDITEKRKAQELVAGNEERFRALVENAGDMISLTNSKGEIIYVSPAFEKITGYSLEELQGKSSFFLIHPDHTEDSKKALERLINEPGVKIPRVNRFVHKQGQFIHVEGMTINLLHNKNVQAIVANYRDITERKISEQLREFDHHNLDALINNTKDLMWSISRSGELITSNSAFDEMVKLMSGNTVIKGAPAPTLGFSEAQLKKWENWYTRAFSGESFTIVEHTTYPSDYWSEISFYPFRKGDEIVGTACYSRNITERKLFEKKLEKNTSELLGIKKELQHSEQRLKQAQEVAHVGNWEINFATNTSIWSDEAYRIYGLEPGQHELSVEDWLAFIHPEDFAEVKKGVDDAAIKLCDSTFRHRILCKDGKIKYVISESRFEFNAQGNPIGQYGTVHDITDLASAEEKLFKSHKLLQKLTDKVPIVTYQLEMDLNGHMTFPFLSQSLLQILPHVQLEEIKKDASLLFSIVHPDDLPKLKATIETSRTHLSDWNHEYRAIGPNGNTIWLSGSARPEKKENGNIQWFGYLRDITEKKLSDQEIYLAKERYDIVAKATNDALYDWDLQTNEVFRTGDGLNVLFGYDTETALSEVDFWKNRMHPDDVEQTWRSFERELNDPGCTIADHEYRFRKADGSYAFVYDKGYIIRNENGEAIRIIGATRDITQRKETEVLLKGLNEKLGKRAEELAISNSELEQFAYIASHDLQEPLRMVTGFLTQLENKYKDQLDEKAQLYIHYATDGAVRMRKIILDLLEYSRVGKKTNNNDVIDTTQLLNEAIQLNKAGIEEKNGVVEFQSLPSIRGNKSRLLQVFQNLVGNALKYQRSNEKPVVKVTARELDTHFQFSVSDNGIGIESQYFDKIFVVFQRLHNKDEYSGTGIGLAICKKIVENHQGRIWVDSEYGKGSTFHFTIAKNQIF